MVIFYITKSVKPYPGKIPSQNSSYKNCKRQESYAFHLKLKCIHHLFSHLSVQFWVHEPIIICVSLIFALGFFHIFVYKSYMDFSHQFVFVSSFLGSYQSMYYILLALFAFKFALLLLFSFVNCKILILTLYLLIILSFFTTVLLCFYR